MDFENLDRFDPLERTLNRSLLVVGILLALMVFAPFLVERRFVKLWGETSAMLGLGDLLPGYFIVFAGVALIALSFLSLTKAVKGAATLVLLLLLPLVLGINLFELKDIEQMDVLRQFGLVWRETQVQTWLLLAGVVAAASGVAVRVKAPLVGRIGLGAGIVLLLAYFFIPADGVMPLVGAWKSVTHVWDLPGDVPGDAARVVQMNVVVRFVFYVIPVVLILLSLPALLRSGPGNRSSAGVLAWAWRLFIPAVYFPLAIKQGLSTGSGEVFLAFARMYLMLVAVVVVVPTALDALLVHLFAPNRGIPDLTVGEDEIEAAA